MTPPHPPRSDSGGKGATRSGTHATIAALAATAGVLLLLCGCSTTHFKEAADRETYAIIAGKAAQVPNMDPAFTIDQEHAALLEDLPVVTEPSEALGEAAQSEIGAAVLSLEKALELAVHHNREYQTRKEALYLEALALTLDRHQYTPIFAAGGSASYNRSTVDRDTYSVEARAAQAAPAILRELSTVTGAPGDFLNRYATIVEEAATLAGVNQPDVEIVDERSVSGQTGIGVDYLMKSGATIAVDLTSNFLRFLTGDPRVATSSALIATVRQPLLRGAGSKVAAERLTQAERDVLYALRDYTRFRKEFTVDIVNDYFGVLLAREVLENNYQSYLAFRRGAERDRALVAEGRREKSALGRIQQAELDAENGWTNSVRRYKQALDAFKIRLGLPTDLAVVLDQNELERMKEEGIRAWVIPAEEAVEVALATRLDLYNTRDSVEDAARGVEVAANALKPDLDLLATADVDSVDGDRFQELDFRRARWSIGLDAALPLNRKAERNAYRAALIALERSERELELAIDTVKLQVRDDWRTLQQAEQTYEIRLIGVEINENRVAEQQLLAELGRGEALDLVDAQNDLTRARNDLAEAVVNHMVARLQFWLDMGILYIKKDGQWEDISDDTAA